MLLFSSDNLMFCVYRQYYVVVERCNFDDYCGITALIVWDMVFLGDEIASLVF